LAEILVVDDDIAICRVLEEVVSNMGHAVHIANNGKEALDCLMQNEKIDLVVTDIVMPVMDGRELMRLIRDNTKLLMLPVIIMSSFVTVADIADLLEMGPNTFMAKPLHLDVIEEQIERYLNMAHGENND
jgi:CheY-like chemotaxis protein